MPNSWYNIGACGDDDFLQSICANTKPYFMIYIYDEVKAKYKTHIKTNEIKCWNSFQCSIDDLYNIPELDRTEEQKDFLFWYEYRMPVGLGNCAMNRICHYVERELDGYKLQLHKDSTFDYNILKVKRRCTEEHRKQLKELEKYYSDSISEYSKKVKHISKYDSKSNRDFLRNKAYEKAKEICPNDDERLNIILDITYSYNGNRQFCWDTIGDLILQRLEELK